MASWRNPAIRRNGDSVAVPAGRDQRDRETGLTAGSAREIAGRGNHAKAPLARLELSVTEIALEVGFCETSAFSAAFRKLTGHTPTGYRRSLIKRADSRPHARDRNGATTDAVLARFDQHSVRAVLGAAFDRSDAVVCTDSARPYAAFSKETSITHRRKNLAAGRRVVQCAIHIPHVYANHRRLKDWMRRLRGVSTRYLANLPRLASCPRARGGHADAGAVTPSGRQLTSARQVRYSRSVGRRPLIRRVENCKDEILCCCAPATAGV